MIHSCNLADQLRSEIEFHALLNTALPKALLPNIGFDQVVEKAKLLINIPQDQYNEDSLFLLNQLEQARFQMISSIDQYTCIRFSSSQSNQDPKQTSNQFNELVNLIPFLKLLIIESLDGSNQLYAEGVLRRVNEDFNLSQKYLKILESFKLSGQPPQSLPFQRHFIKN